MHSRVLLTHTHNTHTHTHTHTHIYMTHTHTHTHNTHTHTVAGIIVGFEFASYSFNEDAGVVMVTINSSAALPPNATIQVSGGTAFIYDVTVQVCESAW